MWDFAGKLKIFRAKGTVTFSDMSETCCSCRKLETIVENLRQFSEPCDNFWKLDTFSYFSTWLLSNKKQNIYCDVFFFRSWLFSQKPCKNHNFSGFQSSAVFDVIFRNKPWFKLFHSFYRKLPLKSWISLLLLPLHFKFRIELSQIHSILWLLFFLQKLRKTH